MFTEVKNSSFSPESLRSDLLNAQSVEDLTLFTRYLKKLNKKNLFDILTAPDEQGILIHQLKLQFLIKALESLRPTDRLAALSCMNIYDRKMPSPYQPHPKSPEAYYHKASVLHRLAFQISPNAELGFLFSGADFTAWKDSVISTMKQALALLPQVDRI